jgi:hypothetical protein
MASLAGLHVCQSSVPVSVDAPKPQTVAAPVQTLEDRDNAMLFEIDALWGTPFDVATICAPE